MRLALQTHTPIVPVAVVGSEEQAISIANIKPLADLLGMPAFPILLNYFPLPVRYHITSASRWSSAATPTTRTR